MSQLPSSKQLLLSLGLAVCVVLLAAVIRFWQLGTVPHGLAWDEAAIGYNGFAIAQTRRDEWLERLPLAFRSFGDYKAPLAIYIFGAFSLFIGVSPWSIRVPFALSGIVAVMAMMAVVYQLTQRYSNWQKARAVLLASLAGLFMAVSQWHVHYSRVAFESGMALMWLLVGWVAWNETVTYYEQWLKQSDKKLRFKWFIAICVASISWAASVYTYHSARLVTPLFVAAAFLQVLFESGRWRSQAWWRLVLGCGFSLLILVAPLGYDMVFGRSGERLEQASILTKQLPASELAQILVANTVSHFSPQYLVGGFTPTLRHGTGRWGILSPVEAMLIVGGFFTSIWLFTRKSEFFGTKRLITVGYGWGLFLVVIGTLPAIIGVDVPHSNRALLGFPGFMLLAVIGFLVILVGIAGSTWEREVSGSHGESYLLSKAWIGMVPLLVCIFGLAGLHHYFTTFAAQSASDFKDGYWEAFSWIVPYEKHQRNDPPVDQVVFSSRYGQPYIYALLVRKTDPIWYQGGSLNTYFFADKVTIRDLERPHTAIVASGEDDVPFGQADHIVYGSDGSIRFAVFLPRETHE